MKKKKRIIFLSIILIVLIFTFTYVNLEEKNKNTKEVKVVSSLIEKQEKREKSFKIKGYTVENPNIILDPYQNSPLTALVLFETKNEVAPKVTIEGKDELSTFTHQFKKTKQHYLPIYGLYADKENKIKIEYTEIGKKVSKEIKIKCAICFNNYL